MSFKNVAKRMLAFVLVLALSLSITGKLTDAKAAEGGSKEVITYFANWAVYDSQIEVANIPWDKVTYINHSFWTVGTKERVIDKKKARTKFYVESTDADADLKNSNDSLYVEGLSQSHFEQYDYFSKLFPDVNIMIAVGGWSCSHNFSEMAYTKEGRTSFIDSCVDLMEKYSFIDGIDIDWEYPGSSREPEDEWDHGCTVFGTAKQDVANFVSLLKEMREAFDAKFGEGAKKLTVCAACNEFGASGIDWKTVSKYVNYINVMTYDMAGAWMDTTGHNSTITGCEIAYDLFVNKWGVPASKINIGAPFYSLTWKLNGEIKEEKTVGAKATYQPYVTFTVKDFKEFEKTNGWVVKYDEKEASSYMFNTDPKSQYYKYWISYESEKALQKKIDLIMEKNLAGIIIWEGSQDDLLNGSPMFSILSDGLILQKEYVKKTEGGKTYIEDQFGEKAKNRFMEFEGNTVYVDKNGVLATGIFTVDGSKYYADSKGTVAKSKLVKVGGKTYYADGIGRLAKSQFVNVSGKTYYVDKNGLVAKNKLVTVSKKTYVADKNGVIAKNKLITLNKKTYYVNKNGVVQKNVIVKVSGKKYYANKNGVIQKNKTFKFKNVKYKADAKGVLKVVK